PPSAPPRVSLRIRLATPRLNHRHTRSHHEPGCAPTLTEPSRALTSHRSNWTADEGAGPQAALFKIGGRKPGGTPDRHTTRLPAQVSASKKNASRENDNQPPAGARRSPLTQVLE